MAFQIGQKDFSGGAGTGTIRGAYAPQVQPTGASYLLDAVAKVGGEYVQKNLTKEVMKKQMEGEQLIQQGMSLDEVKSGESWVNTIFGDSATLAGARQAQAEASFLNGYSDIMGKMDELKQLPPEEMNKYITDTYAGYLTGDAQVDATILSSTSKIRKGLIDTHRKEHEAFVQEKNIEAITDVTRAKIEAANKSIGSALAFNGKEAADKQKGLEVEELTGFFSGIASRGKDEQRNVSEQVMLDLRDGKELSYLATKGIKFTNDERGKIEAARRAYESDMQSKQQNYNSRMKGMDLQTLETAYKDLSIPFETVMGMDMKYMSKYPLTDSEIKNLGKKQAERIIKEREFGLAFEKNNSMSVENADEYHKYAMSRINRESATPEDRQFAETEFMNKSIVSPAFQKRVSNGFKLLLQDDKPTQSAVNSFTTLQQLASQGQDPHYALRQLSTTEDKAKYLRISEKVNNGADVNQAILEVSQELEIEEKASSGKYTLYNMYDKNDTKKDRKAALELCDDSVTCGSTTMVELQAEMQKISTENQQANLDVEELRDIAVSNLKVRRHGGVAGLTEEVLASSERLKHNSTRWKDYQPKDMIKHYFTETNKPFAEDFSVRYTSSGNFIVNALDDNGMNIEGSVIIPREALEKTWESSSAYKAYLREEKQKLKNIEEAKKDKPSFADTYYKTMESSLGQKGKQKDFPDWMKEAVGTVGDVAGTIYDTTSPFSLVQKANKAIEEFFANPYSTNLIKEKKDGEQ